MFVRSSGTHALRHGSLATRCSLLVAHREQIKTLDVTFAEEPPAGWRLEADPGAGPAAQTRLAVWLGHAPAGTPR